MKVYNIETKKIQDINNFDKKIHLTQEQYENKITEVLKDEKNFKKKLNEVENKLNEIVIELEQNRDFLLKKYGGKKYSKYKISKLKDDFPLNISSFKKAESIALIDINQSIEAVIENLIKIKNNFKPENNKIYCSDVYLDEYLDFYPDGDYSINVNVCVDLYVIKDKIDKYDLRKIKNELIQQFFPVKVKTDDEIFKEYLEGYLTIKGLFKKINIFI